MERHKHKDITDVLYEYLRQNGLETPLNEYRLIKSWNELLGPAVARYTTNLKIYNQILYVTLSSPLVRNELNMRRSELVKALNEHVGAQVITRMVLK